MHAIYYVVTMENYNWVFPLYCINKIEKMQLYFLRINELPSIFYLDNVTSIVITSFTRRL